MKTKLLFIVSTLILLPLNLYANQPSILINEIAWMGTTVSANSEWLELYNPTEQNIDLNGWRLEAADGSPKINLSGTIPAGSYFLLERTADDTLPDITADQTYTGSLSNSGEWLKLYDQNNNLIDEINGSAAWPAGDNNTKQTLERTNNQWQTSAEVGGTPKAQNSTASTIPPPVDENNLLPAQNNTPTPPSAQIDAKKGEIIITEIFPAPSDGNSQNEFVELKNISQNNLDLTDWKITNLAKQKFIIPSLIITPGCHIIFDRTQTNLVLNNFQEKITLYDKNGKIIDQASFKTQAPDGLSYQKNSDNQWSWENITPGQENIFKVEIMPQATIYAPKTGQIGQLIIFDGSDSFDPQKRPLKFLWNFGNGQSANNVTSTQTYLLPGNYEIALNVFVNNEASSTETFKIKITDPENKEDKTEEKPTTTPEIINPAVNNSYFIASTQEKLPTIFISEFLPNPTKENNQQEFIELFNQEDFAVDLGNFQLDDSEKGSKPYTIPPGTIIQPGQYLAFLKDQTKIALNNSDDSVRLIAPSGQVIDAVSYQTSQAGVSYVLDQDFTWQQTQTPTPGEINSLDSQADEEEKTPTILGAELDPKLDQKNIYQNNTSTPATINTKTKYFIAAGLAVAILVIAGLLKLKSDR